MKKLQVCIENIYRNIVYSQMPLRFLSENIFFSIQTLAEGEIEPKDVSIKIEKCFEKPHTLPKFC